MVDLCYYDEVCNVGDLLSPVIVRWMKERLEIRDESTERTSFLAVGSILAASFFNGNGVIWGTGTHYIEDGVKIAQQTIGGSERKLDIRAVRGPITRRILEFSGYPCPHIYGDPAILMPRIYERKPHQEKGKITLIRHITNKQIHCPGNLNIISTKTNDYQKFIDEICSSEKVISSSLHGIILAESYGIPAIFFQDGRQDELLKFYDWYYSTGRLDVKIAYTAAEAVEMMPMALPDLHEMADRLLTAFPKDIFEKDYHIKKKDVRIVLFGVGECFSAHIDEIQQRCRVEFVCDNDPGKWGRCFCGLQCISPEKLVCIENAYVVITVWKKQAVEEIRSQLKAGGIFYYEWISDWLRHSR